jgi:hypothetical protein
MLASFKTLCQTLFSQEYFLLTNFHRTTGPGFYRDVASTSSTDRQRGHTRWSGKYVGQVFKRQQQECQIWKIAFVVG